MMSDYSRTQELITAAYDSEGSSQEQFEKTLDSLEAKLNELKNAWNAFTMGLANNDVIKFVVDALTLLLNLFNKVTDMFGSATGSVLKLVAAFALFAALIKTVPKLTNKISTSIVTGLSKSGDEAGTNIVNSLTNKLKTAPAQAYEEGVRTGQAWTQGTLDGMNGGGQNDYSRQLLNQGGQNTGKSKETQGQAKDGSKTKAQKKDSAGSEKGKIFGDVAVGALGAAGLAISSLTNNLREANEELTKQEEAALKGNDAFSAVAVSAASIIPVLVKIGVVSAASMGWIALIAAAVAAAVAAVIYFINKEETVAERAERLNKEYEKQKKLINEISSGYDAYVTANNELDDLINGTEEYTQKLNEATEAALALNAASNGEIPVYWDGEKWYVDPDEVEAYQKSQQEKLKKDDIDKAAADLTSARTLEYNLLGGFKHYDGVGSGAYLIKTSGLAGVQLTNANQYNDLLKALNTFYTPPISDFAVPDYDSSGAANKLEELGYQRKEKEDDASFINRVRQEAYDLVVNSGDWKTGAKFLYSQSDKYEGFAKSPLSLKYDEITALQEVEEEELKQYLISQGVEDKIANDVAYETVNSFSSAVEDAFKKAGVDREKPLLTDTQKSMSLEQLINQSNQKKVLQRSEDSGATLISSFDTILNGAKKELSPEQFERFVDYITKLDYTDLTELEGLSTIIDDMDLKWEDGQKSLDSFIANVKEAGIAIRKSFNVNQYEEAVLSNRLTTQDKIENREAVWTEDEYSIFAKIAEAAGEKDWIDKNFTQNKEGEHIFIGDYSELKNKTTANEDTLYAYAKESLTWKADAETKAKEQVAESSYNDIEFLKASAALSQAQKEYEKAKGTSEEAEKKEQLLFAQTQYEWAEDKASRNQNSSFLDTYATQQDFKSAAAVGVGEEGYISNDFLKAYIKSFFGGLEESQFEDLTGFTFEGLASANLTEENRQDLINLISDYVYNEDNSDTLKRLEEQGAFNNLNQNQTQVLGDSTISKDEKEQRLKGFIEETEGAAVILEQFSTQLTDVDNTTRALAVTAAQSAKRFADFGDAVKDNIGNLKDAKKGTVEYNKALAAITNLAKKAFGEDVNMNVLLSDMERLEKAANGDMEAFREIQKALYDDMDSNAVQDLNQALEETGVTADQLFNHDWSMEPTLDIGQWTGNAEELLKKAENVTSSLANLGMTSEYIYDEHGAVTGVRITGSGYSGLAGRSSGGGGGGGGGSKKNWENPYDPLYNLTEEINEALREREKLERSYDRLLESRNASFSDLIENTISSMANLRHEIELQKRLQEGRRSQLENIASETYTDDDGKETTFEAAGVTKYGYYDFETQSIVLDLAAINAVKDEEEGAAIEAYIGRLEELQEQYEETQETLEDMEDTLEELKQRGKEEYLDFEQKVYDAIVQRQQTLIDDFEDLSSEISDTNSKILEDLQNSIDLQRQIRDNTKTEEDIADKEARLAYLQRDTSGANAVEILKLQEELDQARQDYQDTLIDQELDRLNEANDIAAEQRERQIEIMQSQLEWQEKNGEFWEETYALIQGAFNEDGTFNNNSALVQLLKDTDSFKGMSEFGKMNWITELIKEYNQSQLGFASWMVDKESVEGNVLDDSKGLVGANSLTYKDGDWVDEEGSKYSVVYDPETRTYQAEKVEPVKGVDEFSGGQVVPSPEKGKNRTYTAEYKYYYYAGIKGIKYIEKKMTSTISQKDAELKAKAEQDKLLHLAIEKQKNDQGFKAVSYEDLDQTRTQGNGLLKYATGGLNTETGPAWLDGTPSRPEYVLNATQTDAFLKLTEVLPSIMKDSVSAPISGGDTYYDVKFLVDEISSDYDVDKLWERFKQKIYEDGSYRNTTVINRLR